MLSETLVKAGFETEVYATTANGKEELPVISGAQVNVDGVEVTYFKRITKDHSHFSPALFKKLWKQAPGFDLIHIHAWWNLVSIFSCFIAMSRRVPVLLSPRGTLSPYSFQNKNIGPKQFIHNILGRRLLNSCYLHATSQREYEAIKMLIHPKSITVLPNFVKLPTRKTYIENAKTSFLRLIFFSRIEEKKGLDILLNALALVTVQWQLTIAGNGDEEYIAALKEIAAGLKINDKINWAGFYTEDKFDLLHDHDLFILPSHDENFGNAVIESLSVGTPVLISEHVGLADYVVANNLGWVCETTPKSVSDMIKKIALNHIREIGRIREDAPDIIYHDFDEHNLVEKYIGMYKQIGKE
jgi:glycosyltransferase involved in cell wall biosynthesis